MYGQNSAASFHQVDSARVENAQLRSELDGLRRSADESKEAEANRRDIENMRGEIVMLSKSFSDFVRRYRDALKDYVPSNSFVL